MKITIEVEDQHKFRTLMDWLWSNHFLETATVQTHKWVTPSDDDAENDEFWMKVTEETLREDWEAPENDVWDKLYAERHGGL